MDTIEHFTTRHITDSSDWGLDDSHMAGLMEITTDDVGRFLINVTANGDGAGIYMDKDARKELIAILLKTL